MTNRCLLILLLVLGGCKTSEHLPQKALIEPKQIYSAVNIARELNGREGVAIPKGKTWYKVIEGSSPIIITAPHATRPWRNSKRRFSDGGGTAALAIALGKLTGAYVIYTTYEGPSDPNYYDDNEFKSTLSQLIGRIKPIYLLDIHGSHPYHSYDIDIGTMNGKSLMGNNALVFNLIQRLKDEGIESISYNRFSAAKNATITKFAFEHGVPAMQLELNTTYVTPSIGNIEAQRFSKLLQALTRFIREQKINRIIPIK
jgi:hypothetical protein